MPEQLKSSVTSQIGKINDRKNSNNFDRKLTSANTPFFRGPISLGFLGI